jgi:hypothetical protein
MRLTILAAVIAALAACRTPPPMTPGAFQVAPQYASLFKPYEAWTYHVAGGPAPEPDDDTATSVVVKCRADKVVPFSGGVTSHIKCNLPTAIAEETGVFPLEGVWMANADGLWHVHAGAEASLDNATLILRAHPSEGHVDPDQLTGDDRMVEIAKDGDAWCATHQTQLDVENFTTMCFATEGVRSGRYGWKEDANVHETRFELAR